MIKPPAIPNLWKFTVKTVKNILKSVVIRKIYEICKLQEYLSLFLLIIFLNHLKLKHLIIYKPIKTKKIFFKIYKDL